MLVQRDDLANLRRENNDKTIALAFGTFDIIHPDHIKYLTWAKQQCDILVVTITHNDQVAQSKGAGRPILDQHSRAELVDALKPVDYVVPRDTGGPYESARLVVDDLQPDLLVFGADWGQNVIDEWRGDYPDLKIVTAPSNTEFSTTKIINKIQSLT